MYLKRNIRKCYFVVTVNRCFCKFRQSLIIEKCAVCACIKNQNLSVFNIKYSVFSAYIIAFFKVFAVNSITPYNELILNWYCKFAVS